MFGRSILPRHQIIHKAPASIRLLIEYMFDAPQVRTLHFIDSTQVVHNFVPIYEHVSTPHLLLTALNFDYLRAVSCRCEFVDYLAN